MLNSESSAADQMGTDVHVIDIDLLLHIVVDNVDHKSDTIDG